MRNVFITPVLVALFTAAACAQSCLDYSSHLRWSGRGTTGGSVSGAAVSGDLLFAGIDNVGLKIYGLEAPDTPAYRGAFQLPGSFWRLHAEGARVILLSTGIAPQLFVIDATDPTAPSALGGLSLAVGVKDMAVDGDLAAVVRQKAGDDELILIDLSVPSLPQTVSTVGVPDGVLSVSLAGGRVAVAGSSTEVRLFDVSDPASPTALGSWSGAGQFRDLALVGDRLWLLNDGGLRVLDLSVPAAPALLGALSLERDWGRLAVRGDVAWIVAPDLPDGLGQTCRIDVADPAAPVLMGCLGVGASDVVASTATDRIYLARGGRGVDVAAGTEAVASVGFWPLPDPTLPPTALALTGDLALVAVDATTPSGNPRGTLHLVDLADPVAPFELGSIPVTGVPSDVAAAGGLALVPWYHVRLNRGGVSFLDVSDPAVPVELAEFQVYGEPTRVLWSPPWALVGVRGTTGPGSDHLLVLYAADPSNPVLAEEESLPYAPTGLSLVGTRLVLTGGGGALSWLDEYDFSTPDEPLLVESFGLNRVFNDLTARGDFLYALEEGGTVDLLDLSYGDFIWYRAVSWLPEPGRNLTLVRDRLHVTGGDLLLADVSDPDVLLPAGSYASGTAVDVAVGDDCLHLLDAAGLWSLPTDCAGVTPVYAQTFTARRERGAVRLEWRLSGEGEGMLEVEGVADGRTWILAPSGPGRAVDPSPPAGAVEYALVLVDDGTRTRLARSTLAPADLPTRPRFLGAGPNPFNPRTTLRYALPAPGPVRVTVHTLDGARVRVLFEGEQAAGEHALPWDGRDGDGRSLPSGAYLCRLEADGRTSALRVTLVR